jgi:ketosteroid isomerase-like protein
VREHAAVLEWRVRARTAAGRDYDNRYLGIFEVADDQITSVREYTDTAYMNDILFSELSAQS